MFINCDIGERGRAHEVDDRLMRHIHIANIACGGHAGDQASVDYYLQLAESLHVTPTAHLSYPDKQYFGRRKLNISPSTLLQSLSDQLAHFKEIETVKLHGALYNEASLNANLAEELAHWFKAHDIHTVLTPHGSQLALTCKALGIKTLYEAFLDRRYIYDDAGLRIAPRSEPNALHQSAEEVYEQYLQFQQGALQIDNIAYAIKAQTLCIHSDSSIALEALQKIRHG